MAPNITPGDLIKTENGSATVEGIEDDVAVFGDGRRMTMKTVVTGIRMDRFEHVPRGGERDTFLRFGDLPDGERSYDTANERYEDGVSVYGAEKVDGAWVPTGPKALGALLLLHRGAFLVSGERVGTGADGEPVIRNVEIEAELETPEGVKGFVPVEDG